MRISFVIILVLLSLSAYSQNQDNYIEILPNTSLSFNANTVSEVENDQTISNALTIQIENKDRHRDVYARISAVSVPAGFSATSPYPIKLDFTSHNSQNVNNLVTTPLQLTNTDQRLFTQQKRNNVVMLFNYDLVLMATNWNYPPGNYSFTVLFTLTPP